MRQQCSYFRQGEQNKGIQFKPENALIRAN